MKEMNAELAKFDEELNKAMEDIKLDYIDELPEEIELTDIDELLRELQKGVEKA